MPNEHELATVHPQNPERQNRIDPGILDKLMGGGDLSGLSPQQRSEYYVALCERLKLNWLSQPFAYLFLDKKLVLYVRKDATDQLRNIHGVSVEIRERNISGDICTVIAKLTLPNGRTDESIGAVPLKKEGGRWTTVNGQRVFEPNGQLVDLSPAERANAYMRSETKSKRRGTLSIIGLGMMDESELDTLPDARPVSFEEAQKIPQTIESAQSAPQAPPDPAQALRDRMKTKDDIISVFAELRDQLMQILGDEQGAARFREMLRLHNADRIEGFAGRPLGEVKDAAVDIAQRIGNIRASVKEQGNA